MATEITKVAGIGPKMADQLKQQGIKTAEQLIAAGVDRLTTVPGISQTKAEAFIAAAGELVGETAPFEAVEVDTGISTQKAKASPVEQPQDTEAFASAEEHKKNKKHKKKKEKRLKDKKIKDKKKKDRKKKKKKNKKSKHK